MLCPNCHGSLFDEGASTIADVVDDQPYVVYNVPRHRCRQCGFDIMSADTIRKIEGLLLRPAMATAEVLAYDLARVTVVSWYPPAIPAYENYAHDQVPLVTVTAGTAEYAA